MPKERPNFLGLTKAKSFAASLGFTKNPIQKSKTLYLWTDPQTPFRTLSMDILSKHINIKYRYEDDITILVGTKLPRLNRIIQEASDFLERNQLLPFDVDPIPKNVSFFKLTGTKLAPVNTIDQASVVRVDFFRNTLDDMPVITPDPTRGIISILLSGSENNKKKVLILNWQYWPVSYNTYGRYALIDSNTAWNKLQSGQAYIAQAPKNVKQITIRKVYIAYYDTYESQLFFQPVFVFEGDANFVAYVSAVKY